MTPSLDRLRLRLTLWYAGVLTVILVLLGAGIFVAIRHQMTRHLDASLKAATAAVMQASLIREMERTHATGVADAVAELHIPDRALYLFDVDGRPLVPSQADGWIEAAARQAARSGVADVNRDASGEREFRVHAERFTGGTGTVYVAGAGYLLVRQATAPIERSMDQMRRFMADAAHELRTPVTVLRSRAEVMLAQARNPTRDAAALRAIEQETTRLGEIIGDLLTLARADAGERPVARAALYLDDVASDAVAAVRALAERQGVALEVGQFEEARIVGDPALVRRLLLIVLDNAIKYTPAGGRVRLDVATADGARSAVVTDTGIGIPADQLPHVFDRFYRGDPARRAANGTGLGLAIARWIADLHGAVIAIGPSADGTGTRD